MEVPRKQPAVANDRIRIFITDCASSRLAGVTFFPQIAGISGAASGATHTATA